MRAVTVKGQEDTLKAELRADVSLIADIMERGRYVGELTYELDVTGAELASLIARYEPNAPWASQITPHHGYTVRAYDW